jgi:hypothetical protein
VCHGVYFSASQHSTAQHSTVEYKSRVYVLSDACTVLTVYYIMRQKESIRLVLLLHFHNLPVMESAAGIGYGGEIFLRHFNSTVLYCTIYLYCRLTLPYVCCLSLLISHDIEQKRGEERREV